MGVQDSICEILSSENLLERDMLTYLPGSAMDVASSAADRRRLRS